ncbi:MAG: flagellar biosynthesis anti-sigma factor FlgM [Fibrobacter sp.]|nr:flagellar biosynthesis anti-sigma factor FlgM [Fibrobacter sp.]
MYINANVHSENASELRRANNLYKSRKDEPVSKTSHTDHSEISSEAQGLSNTESMVKLIASQISSEPEIMQEKISETRKKIQDGFYNSEEFLNDFASKMLQDFGIPESTK